MRAPARATLRIGEAETLRAHAVARAAGRRGRASHRPADGRRRFVGRGRELELLRDSFDAAAAGHGQVVVRRRRGGPRQIAARWPSFAAELDEHAASLGRGALRLLRRDDGLPPRHRRAPAVRRASTIATTRPSARAKVDRARGGARATTSRWTLPFVRQVLALDAGDAAVAALDSASRRSETFRALKALHARAAPSTCRSCWSSRTSTGSTRRRRSTWRSSPTSVPTTRVLLVCSLPPGLPAPVRRPQLPRARLAAAALADARWRRSRVRCSARRPTCRAEVRRAHRRQGRGQSRSSSRR